jgi:hypothetical protein
VGLNETSTSTSLSGRKSSRSTEQRKFGDLPALAKFDHLMDRKIYSRGNHLLFSPMISLLHLSISNYFFIHLCVANTPFSHSLARTKTYPSSQVPDTHYKLSCKSYLSPCISSEYILYHRPKDLPGNLYLKILNQKSEIINLSSSI